MLERLTAPAWLLQTTLPDTIFTRTITEDPGAFEKITGIADGLTSILVLVLVVALVPAAWNLRRTHVRLNALLDRFQDDLTPIVKHASAIADDIHYISTALRTDVAQVSRTVNAANARMQEAIHATERKVREFNALLAVVQEEAEDIFVRSAAAARGVRTGVESFRVPRERAASRRSAPGDTLPLDPETGEDDGDELDDLPPARPRVRPRHGN